MKFTLRIPICVNSENNICSDFTYLHINKIQRKRPRKVKTTLYAE